MNRSRATSTVQFETERVRVSRWVFAPGTETGMHRHEFDYVVVPVIAGVLTITDADGSEVEAPIDAGISYERRAGVEHNVANVSESPIAFVEVELLDRAGRSSAEVLEAGPLRSEVGA